ncbi:M15 family metallopeptidase [Streptomyces sp. NBC_00457]|uniref:M15 family metallopeptidase n=1 Tax=Streptomyces sp. NBC_00457 TaxID=2975748 RepID=UPI002E2238ED
MTYSQSAGKAAARRTRSAVLAAFVAISATVVGVLFWQALASSPSSSWASLPSASASPTDTPEGDHRRTAPKGVLGEADGALPDGVTVFDDGYPGVTKLNPELLEAVREAATDASGDGVTFYVNSGWRSAELQSQLLREAVAKYGSEEEAARWVATADTSPHVSGDAIDIGQDNATTWLSEHGAEYGLCQIYGNEPWHYELRPEAVDDGCPAMYADPAHDPRMRQ